MNDADDFRKKMEAARVFIQKKDYASARAILVTLDHPNAREWLARIDASDPRRASQKNPRASNKLNRDKPNPVQPKRGRRRWWVWAIGVFGLLVVCSMVGQALNIIPTTDERDATKTAESAAAVALEATNFALTPPTATATITNTPTQTLTATITPSATITETPVPTDTSSPVTPSPTITETSEGTAIPSSLEAAEAAAHSNRPEEIRLALVYAIIADIRRVGLVYAVNDNDRWTVNAEIEVEANSNNVTTADQLRESTYATLLSAFVEFSVILDDGETIPADYRWDNQNDEWVITPLTSAATARASSSSVVQPALDNVLTVNPQTYYIASGGARLRSQPNTSSVELTFLNGATAITVTGMIDGQAVEAGNLVWYVTSWQGQTAYVYSGVVSSNIPSVPAPVVQPISPAPVSPAPQSPFGCNGMDDLNCSDFYAIGQNANAHLAQCGDEDDLDGNDQDGRACEQN